MLEFLLGHSLWAFRSGEIAFARGWPLWVLFVLAAWGSLAIAWTLLRNRQLGMAARWSRSACCSWHSSRCCWCCCGGRC